MKRLWPLLLAVGWAAAASATEIASVGSEATQSLDLERVIALALERNPTLKSIEERRTEVEAGVREAWADAFPQLALRSSWNQSRNPSLLNSADFEDLVDLFPDFSPATQELYNASIEVSQPLFTAGKVASGIKLARIAVAATTAQIATARLDAGRIAAEAYFRYLEAEKGLETIEIQRQARRESLAVVQARYDLGEATRLEQLQAQATLAELEPIVTSARGAVLVAEINLRAVLDLPDKTSIQVVELTDPLPALPDAARTLDFASQTRPEFDDLELQIEGMGKLRSITKADGYPHFDLAGYYGRTVRDLDNFNDNLFQDWAVGVAMRWEFYDGGRRRGQVAQLDSQKQQLVWQLAALHNQVEQEVLSALTGYEASLKSWEAAEISAEASREASRVAGESYRQGVTLQTDLLTAQEREVVAEVTLVQAYFGARISATRLARAAGLQADEAWQFTGHETGEQP